MAAGSSSSELVDYRQSIRMQAGLLLVDYSRSCIHSYTHKMAYTTMGIANCSLSNSHTDNMNHNNYYSQH